MRCPVEDHFHCTCRNGCRQQVQSDVTLSAQSGIYAMMGSATAQNARWMAFHESFRSPDRTFSGRHSLDFYPFLLRRLSGSAVVCRSGTNDSSEQSVRSTDNVADNVTVTITDTITDTTTNNVADSNSDAIADSNADSNAIAIAIAGNGSRADRFQCAPCCISGRP